MIVPTNFSALRTAASHGVVRRAVALFVLVVCARVVYISLFGVQTPFWDQWDAEAANLLKPWQDGTWSLTDLLSPHNEHRIAVTRLASLLVFETNGEQWNNLVSAYLNVPLAAAYLAILFWFLAWGASPRAQRGTFLVAAIVGVLPYSWENFLVGFQNQFYFMALLAIVAMALAAFRPDHWRYVFATAVAAFLGLVTTAGGVVGPVGVLIIVGTRTWQRRSLSRMDLVTAVLMAAAIATALVITPNVPGHEVLRAAGLQENIRALITALMWPIEALPGMHFRFHFKLVAVIAIWLPPALWTWRFLRGRGATPAALFALGIAGWGFVQALAIAHSRGHELGFLPSRYSDIPAIALIANAWFAFSLLDSVEPGPFTRRTAFATAAAFLVVTGYGLVARLHEDVARIASRAHYSGIETTNVAEYMATRDAGWLQKPLMEIPYPDPTRLRTLLDDPTIGAMLPPVLNGVPPDRRKAAPLTAAANALQHGVRRAVEAIVPGIVRVEAPAGVQTPAGATSASR